MESEEARKAGKELRKQSVPGFLGSSLFLFSSIVLLCSGCYSVGFEPAAGLREIAVPVFENHTLRREVEHDLTRHVRREILEGTPLHLVRAGTARAVLKGAVISVRETVLVAGDAEEVLASSLVISATFGVYEDGRLVIGEDLDGDGSPDGQIALEGLAEFNASRGESREDATDEALRDLAEMIVYRLEARRDDRLEPNNDAEQASILEPGRQVALQQRDADWFRVEVPARHALLVTLYFSHGDLVLHAVGAKDAERSDEGRILRVLGGETKTTVLLKVTGDDSGAAYKLAVRVEADDGAEPDSIPEQAVQLPGGRTRWRVRRLQRDDDYLAIAVPSGQGLRAKLVSSGKALEIVATDDLGAQRIDVEHADDRRSLSISAGAESQRVLLRVSGDDEGRLYTLEVELFAD